ncbi:hypothetical protein [Streptomyces sp. ADI95-17]|uniref:hypothetical protein n=1 Tax=Streptomyces sp. ADI95-17 TaxID=1522759 RepID=UPI000FC35E0A|nr:hypothetical protein [Streptomyces sp. ADI95-17]RPK53938.1 hypothetical protein EES42_43835 [Streptomyces sp. ADI95-17]
MRRLTGATDPRPQIVQAGVDDCTRPASRRMMTADLALYPAWMSALGVVRRLRRPRP